MTHTRVRKRRILSALTAFVLALSLFPTAALAAEEYDSGSGTEDAPYIITTADQLAGIKENLDAHYKLENDIELTGNWDPIGTFEAADEDGETPNTEKAFTGVFDGNGKTISGLKVEDSIAAGLFGCVANGTVKNAAAWLPPLWAMPTTARWKTSS